MNYCRDMTDEQFARLMKDLLNPEKKEQEKQQ